MNPDCVKYWYRLPIQLYCALLSSIVVTLCVGSFAETASAAALKQAVLIERDTEESPPDEGRLAGCAPTRAPPAVKPLEQPPNVMVEHVFAATPAHAWKKLGRFCGIVEWQSLVASCNTDERADGFYRIVKMKDGTEFVERLEYYSRERHEFSYSIISGPVPLQNYSSRLRIVREEPNRARLVWQAWYEDSASDPKVMANQLKLLFENGIRGMQAIVDKPQ